MGSQDKQKEQLLGHLAAIIAVTIWGTTFISSKILLRHFTPIEILLIRFVIGLIFLTLLARKLPRFRRSKEEWLYVFAGLTGVTLYYLLENVALTFTMASNVGVIIATAPFFTAVVLKVLMPEEEKLYRTFFVGFAIALTGIALISYNGAALSFDPLGDLLTVLAAFSWAIYSYFLKKINSLGYPTIENTQKIFMWGILFMIPAAWILGFNPDVQILLEPINLMNMLFLAVGACAVCFVIWNYAVLVVGAVKTSVYIYLDPIITVVTSALILHEPVTGMMILGTILTLSGLVVSEWRPSRKGA